MSRRSYPARATGGRTRPGPSRHPSSAARTCLDAMAVRLTTRWLRATPLARAGSSLTVTENFRAHDHGGAVPGE